MKRYHKNSHQMAREGCKRLNLPLSLRGNCEALLVSHVSSMSQMGSTVTDGTV